jgi:hypothetical protein
MTTQLRAIRVARWREKPGWRMAHVAGGAFAALLFAGPSLAGEATPPTRRAQANAAVQPLIRCAKSPSGTVLRIRPTTCTIFGPGGSFAGGVNLARLHWISWGSSTAVGSGIEQGFHLPLEHIKVTVTLSRIVSCGGKRFYTRAQVTSGYGTTVAHPIGCPHSGPPANLFGSPSGMILCATGATLGDRSILVFCQERGTNPYFAATISVTGQVRRVSNNGDPGDTPIRTIPYGQSIAWTGVRCTSMTTGMRCTDTGTGHGFLINLAGVHVF